MTLEPSRNQIEIFVNAVFRHAAPTGVVSIRSFYEKKNRAFRLTPAPLTGGLRHLIDVAEDDARRAAQDPEPVVFCPPLATFTRRDRASEQDIAEGLALSVECDEHPQEARTKLEALLGAATVVVKSGGVWLNGGEPEDRLHLHWRLAVPAKAASELSKLKTARDLAARLVGGDPSNKPVCHCIRWPGSWHRKNKPRPCRIAALNADNEIDLDAALDILTKAAEAANLKADNTRHESGDDPHADIGRVAAALAVIPNADVHWDEWNRIGMATWRATAGSDEGFKAFDTWSQKSKKYDQ